MASEVGSELVDVVDEHDRVLASVPRSMMRSERLRHRAVYIVLRRSDGRLLVHRRSDDKDLWPGRWDIAVGGVVGAAEDYDTAAVRELSEEIGVTGVQPQPMGAGAYSDADVDVIGRIYHLLWDGRLFFADGEVVEARWVGPREYQVLRSQHLFVPDSLHFVPDPFAVATIGPGGGNVTPVR